MPAARHVVKYECCPEEYIDVTFTLHIRRRSLFYVSNLVVPCMLMSSLSLLVFVMPPESGEKVTCGKAANQYSRLDTLNYLADGRRLDERMFGIDFGQLLFN